MCDGHPWRLVAPWWRWPLLAEPGRSVKSTRPALQKYDTSDPVSLFVRDPQKTLAYTPDDEVYEAIAYPDVPAGTKRSRFARHFLRSTGTRKLFLPTHKRFYLVVCELHCDTAGFPSVSRDKVCEAGFVVRRRRLSFRQEDAGRAADLARQAGSLSAQIARIDRGSSRRVLRKRHRVTPAGVFGANASAGTAVVSRVDAALEASAVAKRAELQAQLQEVRDELVKWKVKAGAAFLGEGWVPTGAENVGAWEVVGETPDEVVEKVYPLYPLVPDPRVAGHDAAGKTLYFGMIPMSGREVDAAGAARFDDRSRYQVRCFVRRHRCDCPKTGEPNDCGGELVWSEPTEVFQLAPHFDPVGTGNQPVTIQLPDIPVLAATEGARLPVAMVSPEGSSLNFSVVDGEPQPSEPGGFQICYISIPLITIVATFVFNLFLPVVVFVFQLWFLLGLKLCIPPSISFGAGAAAHVDIQGELDIALEADLDVNVGILAGADLNLALTGEHGLQTGGDGVLDPPDLANPAFAGNDSPGFQLAQDYAPAALVELQERVTATVPDPTPESPLWVPRVQRWEVGA
jgi:hypothetical protein